MSYHLRSNSGSNGPIAKECHRFLVAGPFNCLPIANRSSKVKGVSSAGSARAGLRSHGWENPIHQIPVFCGIFQDVPSREDCNQIFLGKYHEPLSAKAARHPHITLPIRPRQQPPFESVFETLLRVNERSQRLLHSVFGHDLLLVPYPIAKVQVSDFRQARPAKK